MIQPLETTKGKRGRKAKDHVQSWDGQTVNGLYRKGEKVWRVRATGQEFTEPDERRAVARFHALTAGQGEQVLPLMRLDAHVDLAALVARHNEIVSQYPTSVPGPQPDGPWALGPSLPEIALWEWMRKELTTRPVHCAKMTGIAQLARLADLPMPKAPIRLEDLIKAYEAHAECKPVSRRKARVAWDEFVRIIGGTILSDVSTEKFIAYRDNIRSRGLDAETVAYRFGRVKTIIRFGLTRGMDADQIRAALDRAAVLVAPKSKKTYTPHPVSRDHFHALLEKAEDDALMTAVLLTALNLCMYPSEVLSIQWDELDLDKGTYVAHTGRGKTGVVRVGALWPRTVAALKKLKRTPGPVFKSSRGCAYHPHSLGKLYAKLRTAAKVPAEVEFNWIRDGAYSAACCQDVPFHLAQILAGHRQGAESDHYIARDPAMVKPAVDAIDRAYFDTKKKGGR